MTLSVSQIFGTQNNPTEDLVDMGTAEVVRAQTAQDTLCGIHRSTLPQDRSILSPKLRHFLLQFRLLSN